MDLRVEPRPLPFRFRPEPPARPHQDHVRRIELERWRADRSGAEALVVPTERLGAEIDNHKVKEALDSQVAEYRATRDARLQQLALLDNKIASEEEDLSTSRTSCSPSTHSSR